MPDVEERLMLPVIPNPYPEIQYCGNLREVIKFAFLVFLIFLLPYHQNPFRHLMLL